MPPAEDIVFSGSVTYKKAPGQLLLIPGRLIWISNTGAIPDIRLPLSEVRGQKVVKEKPYLKLLTNLETNAGYLFLFSPPPPVASSSKAPPPPSSSSSSGLSDPFESRTAFLETLTGLKAVAATPTSTSTPKTSFNVPALPPVLGSSLDGPLVPPSPSGSTPSPAPSAPHGLSAPLSKEQVALRMAVLKSDPTVAKLHSELVASGAVPEEDFWAAHQGSLDKEKARVLGKAKLPASTAASAALVDFRPRTEHRSTKIRYKLTQSIIEAIFSESPSIAAAFNKYVPAVVDERTFWRKYLDSRHFHRHRSSNLEQGKAARATFLADGHKTLEDVFDAALDEDEALAASKAAVEMARIDPTVDLRTSSAAMMQAGYGIAPDATVLGNPDRPSSTLIRRFNRHGEHVLAGASAAPNHGSVYTRSAPVTADSQTKTANGPSATETASAPLSRDQIWAEVTHNEDLEPDESEALIPLEIAESSRYHSGMEAREVGAGGSLNIGGADSGNANATEPKAEPASESDATAWVNEMLSVTQGVEQELSGVVANTLSGSKRARQVVLSGLDDLEGGAAKRARRSGTVEVPKEDRAQLSNATRQANELLRHFWANYPPKNAASVAKVRKVMGLASTLANRLKELKKVLPPDRASVYVPALDAILQPLQSARSIAAAAAQAAAGRGRGRGGMRGRGAPRGRGAG